MFLTVYNVIPVYIPGKLWNYPVPKIPDFNHYFNYFLIMAVFNWRVSCGLISSSKNTVAHRTYSLFQKHYQLGLLIVFKCIGGWLFSFFLNAMKWENFMPVPSSLEGYLGQFKNFTIIKNRDAKINLWWYLCTYLQVFLWDNLLECWWNGIHNFNFDSFCQIVLE